MNPMFEIILLCVGLYFLKRWTAGKVMHHPEWQTMDALDRILHWVLIVGSIWLCVGLVSHGLLHVHRKRNRGHVGKSFLAVASTLLSFLPPLVRE